MIFDRYEWIRVVNLVERTDRRRHMERELARAGLAHDPRVRFVPAIRKDEPGPFARVGSHGAYLSHLNILRDAAQSGVWTLILQDDCQFTPLLWTYDGPECDVFYGGWEYASDPDNLHNSEIIGAHFMGFSPRAATLAVTYLEAYLYDPMFKPDPIAAAKPNYNPAVRPPIDGALVWFRRAFPELTTQFAQLAHQGASRTDIGSQGWFDRTPIVRNIAGTARRVKSAITRNARSS